MRKRKTGNALTGQRDSSYMKLGEQRSVRVDRLPENPNRQQRRQMQKLLRERGGRA